MKLKKLRPETKAVYSVDGVQLFSQTDLAKLVGLDRNTLSRKIKEYEVPARALCTRGNKLFAVQDYFNAINRARVDSQGEERFGGYADALEWKTAVDAQRVELKLKQERGELVDAWEAEMEIATCFSDVAKMGESLLTLVDMVLHPSGEDMERLSQKFKRENSKYYDRIMSETEHAEA
ncbi:hypothetical protein OIX85_003854 [Vibrio parahaemolyticus]|uniref:helix-turn-helix domain-containing protein n=1 Tax=Vibrio alginolyticus TaxID=663 RepID=UPI0035C727E7|nr:hypothetical protein [Vibrio parahaemolyticus]